MDNLFFGKSVFVKRPSQHAWKYDDVLMTLNAVLKTL